MHLRRAMTVLSLIVALQVRADDPIIVSGMVRGDLGEAVGGLWIWLDDITKPYCGCAQYSDHTRSDGTFSIQAPRGDYAIRVLPRSPYRGTYAHADARNGDVRNLAITTSVVPDSTYPDDPPRASRITTAIVDDNTIRIDGAAGAVAGNSFVDVVTIDTGLFAKTFAAPDGSFSLTTFGRPGSSILIRSDRSGAATRNATYITDPNAPTSLATTPGTIIHVPVTAADPLAFDVTGLAGFSAPPMWRATGRMNRRTFSPGDDLVVSGELAVDSTIALPASISGNLTLAIERSTDAGGGDVRGDNVLASTILTPTLLPIEHSQHGSSFNAVTTIVFNRLSDQRATAPLNLTLRLPPELSPGLFRPYLIVHFAGNVSQPQPAGVHLFRSGSDVRQRYLPMIRIGNPSPPRLTSVLLLDSMSGGSRGVRATEDRTRFNLAPRIVTEGETIVVPRTDHNSGALLRYRLEPFLPNISLGNRGEPPEAPRVAFRFPSGSLTTTVHRPDGVVETIGPAPFVQSRCRALVDFNGNPIDAGGAHISDPYQLSTMDPRFEFAFPRDGIYTIEMNGSIDDEDGNPWTIRGTYELHVGEELIVETAVLPGTPFETGDSLDPAVTIFPAMSANVELTFRLAPGSDPSKMITTVVSGTTNRFGWFRPALSAIPLAAAGEYRVDVRVTGIDPNGRYWAGFRTWGGVVAPRSSSIIAHGRRAFENATAPFPAWFVAAQQTTSPLGATHVFFPFNSGDVMWGEDEGAEFPIVTFQDPSATATPKLRTRAFDYPNFDDRASSGEAPLFISNPLTYEVHLEPSLIDSWGYSYRSVTRPLVRVREMIGEDQIGQSGVYWHFDSQYSRQFGVGKFGDLPNDFKFQFGGAVLRGSYTGTQYAIYGSLFVLVPTGDAAGERIFPPFQGNGGGPSGGPLFTLKGKVIDSFFHPTGVRPGSILEVGDTISLSGQAAPLLPAAVALVVTAPSGKTRTLSGRTNRIGYLHDPAHDLVADETGEWQVSVTLTYDGASSGGTLQQPFPSGGILGGDGRSFKFFVVDRGSQLLAINRTPWTFVRPADGPVTISAFSPPVTGTELSYVASSSGFIVGDGRSADLSYTYDLRKLAPEFPNLDLEDQDGRAGVDVVVVSFLVSGNDPNGVRRHYAQQVLLRGEELIVTQRGTRRRAAKP